MKAFWAPVAYNFAANENLYPNDKQRFQSFKIVLKLLNEMEVSDIELGLLINTVGLLRNFSNVDANHNKKSE